MLQLQKIRENRDQIIERLAVKNFKATALVDEIIELDNTRRNSQKELDDILALSNQLAKEIGNHYAKGEPGKAELAKQESLKLKAAAKAIEPLLMDTVELLNTKLIELPNLPHTSVPKGKTPEEIELIYDDVVIPR